MKMEELADAANEYEHHEAGEEYEQDELADVGQDYEQEHEHEQYGDAHEHLAVVENEQEYFANGQ